jgi:hypothetical protein
MKPILWAILGVSLVLAGCSQPLEGTGPGRDSTVSGLGITSFSVAGVKGEIAGSTIYVRDVPLYTVAQTLTDLRNVVPLIGYKGGTLSPAADTPQDFSTPKIYTLLTDDGSQWDYTVIVTARPLRSASEFATYFPIAAKVYAGTEAEPIPVPVGMELSAKGWREILTAVQNGGKSVALDLTACTAGIDMAGGGLYGDHTFDPGPAHTGENKVVSLVLPGEAEKIVGGTAAAPAFSRYTVLGSVFGAGIKDVGQYVFRRCNALTVVSFPAATSIGYDAFSGCDALTTVSLPEATSIGEAAFYECAALTMVSFPAATSIGNDAFNGCEALTTVSLPMATSIGNYAFSGCTALTVPDLPVVVNIGNNAFSGCDALSSVYLSAATSIGNSAFNECTALTTVTLPMARTIGTHAFFGCDALSSVYLPAATSIGNSAFNSCTALSTVSVPEVRTIGTFAFANCDALNSINLPEAKIIGDSAFNDCDGLVSVEFPEVQSLGGSAFYGCAILSSVKLPSVTSAGSMIFAYCDGLISVELPELGYLVGGSFSNCPILSSVKLLSVTTIGPNVFSSNGRGTLTVTLGASPPTISTNDFGSVGVKIVTVKVPDASAYGAVPNGSDNTTFCWANGFRGGGWENGSFVAGGSVNTNIDLRIETYTP